MPDPEAASTLGSLHFNSLFESGNLASAHRVWGRPGVRQRSLEERLGRPRARQYISNLQIEGEGTNSSLISEETEDPDVTGGSVETTTLESDLGAIAADIQRLGTDFTSGSGDAETAAEATRTSPSVQAEVDQEYDLEVSSISIFSGRRRGAGVCQQGGNALEDQRPMRAWEVSSGSCSAARMWRSRSLRR